MTLSLISNALASAPLPYRVRDNLLMGLPAISEGVLNNVFLFSADHPYSWPEQAAPVHGSAIVNLAGKDNSDFLVSTTSGSGPIGWNAEEKAFTFDAVKWTAGPRTPAGWIESQFEAAALQHWLIGGYIKLPSAGQWPTTQSTFHSLMGDQVGGANPKLASFRISRQNDAAPGTRTFNAAFGQTGGSPAGITIAEPTQFMGKWCGIFMYRNATARGLFVEALDQTIAPVHAVHPSGPGAKNTDDLAASRILWGMDAAQAGGGTYYHRVQRGFVENLEATGRAAAVIDVIRDDVARIRARGLIS